MRGANEKVYEGNDATAAALLTSLAAPSLTTTSAPIASQLIFIITTSAGIGPTWNITNFVGPNSTAGLLNGMRVATDTLLISFAPSCQTPAQQAALLDLIGSAPSPDRRPVVAQNYAPVLGFDNQRLFLTLPNQRSSITDRRKRQTIAPSKISAGIPWASNGPIPATILQFPCRPRIWSGDNLKS